MKDRIIQLLGRGVPAANVALALGCDESYISQVVAEDGVPEQISALKAANFQKFTDRDDALEEAESAALTKIKNLLPYVVKPTEAASIFRILNAAKRRTGDISTAQQAPSTVVQINLPAAARVAFVADQNRQIIEIDNRPIITMPAKNLVGIAEQQRAQKLLTSQVPATLDVSYLTNSPANIPLSEKL